MSNARGRHRNSHIYKATAGLNIKSSRGREVSSTRSCPRLTIKHPSAPTRTQRPFGGPPAAESQPISAPVLST